MKRVLSLLLCLTLCLSLSGLPALGEELTRASTFDDPVTRSDFTLSLRMHADAFPAGGSAHLSDWEAFLSKLSLKGTLDIQNPLQPKNAAQLDAWLCLNGQEQVSFSYDRNNLFRFLESPAFGDYTLYWNMCDFFEFCFKGYYYYEFPMLSAGLLLYPESTTQMLEGYVDPVLKTLPEGSRAVSYDELCLLADALQTFREENPHDTYYYRTAVFEPVWMSEDIDAVFSDLQGLLDRLDPQKRGLRVTAEADGTSVYTLGGRTVYRQSTGRGSFSFTLDLPLSDTLALHADYAAREGNIAANLVFTGEEEDERLRLNLAAEGLPVEGITSAHGTVALTCTGSAIRDAYRTEPEPFRFAFTWSVSNKALPCTADAVIDWIHPATGKPAFTVNYHAEVSEQPASVMDVASHTYCKENLFGLNESVVTELKERLKKPLVIAAVPFVLEMPLTCMDDLLWFANDIGVIELLFKDTLD